MDDRLQKVSYTALIFRQIRLFDLLLKVKPEDIERSTEDRYDNCENIESSSVSNTARRNDPVGYVTVNPGGNKIWRSSIGNPKCAVLQSRSISNENRHGEINHAKPLLVKHMSSTISLYIFAGGHHDEAEGQDTGT